MSFPIAVQSIQAIARCYKPGLQALGANSNKIDPDNPRNCTGSVHLDTCLEKVYPGDSRWDYAIGYLTKAYFVEVHPASGQVSEMIAKATWLRNWLKNDGAPLAAIHHDRETLFWIPTKGVNILRKDTVRLAQEKIVVKNHLPLPIK